MQHIRISLENQSRRQLEQMLNQAEIKGDLRGAKRIMAILAIVAGHSYPTVASILDVCERTVWRWMEAFLWNGPQGLKSRKPPGRKPRLSKSQKSELDTIITEGPAEAGFAGACWRTPMIQQLIYERFGVFYSVYYISQLLKNRGFSYQKARFISDHKDPQKRKEWLEKHWPQILRQAEEKDAYILFGDEASFPQWGSLSYTWAKKGHQPVVKTSGNRKAYKVFGLIEYFSGRFFCKGHEGRLNSDSYAAFLKEVMKKTRKHLILIQDGAKYHTSKAMKEFFEKHSNRLSVHQLPSYSPDYNPIEKRWKKIKEKEIHLHYFPTFEALMNKVQEALLRFSDLKNEVLSLFCFYRELTKKRDHQVNINLNMKTKVENL